jgi:cell wall-associated NlpC family hydrolase
MNPNRLLIFLLVLTNSFVFSQAVSTHKVTKGESIYAIAKKYNVKERAIYKLNPKVKGKLLRLNTILQIPNKEIKVEVKTENIDTSFVQKHIVISGETLYGISKKYGISFQELKRINPSVVSKLPIGYVLTIKEVSTIPEPVLNEIEIIVTTENTTDNLEVSSKIEVLIETALKKIGTRYRRGGTSSSGFDCSGLMFSTFKEISLLLPKSSVQQAKTGTIIQRTLAKKGDLIFFTTNAKGTINHVGMITDILGDEIKFIHSSLKLGVIISSTKESYYAKRFIQINRVL